MVAKQNVFPVRFETGQEAAAIHVKPTDDPIGIIDALGLPHPCRTIFITGGANRMEDEEMRIVRPVIEDGLTRFAHDQHIVVIDGGTNFGVMDLIGNARQQYGFTFPLVGIAPSGRVSYPGHDPGPEAKSLDESHSHFILVEGDKFGDESHMITHISHALTSPAAKPALCLVINGGEVTRDETYERAISDTYRFPLLVLEGSGRFADDLVAARDGQPSDPKMHVILSSSPVWFVRITDGPEALYRQLASYFGV